MSSATGDSRPGRPVHRSGEWFDSFGSDDDELLRREMAERTAVLLVRGAREAGDAEIARRVVELADTEGLDVVAELWAMAAPDTLAGCLWRLYLLRSWVHQDPAGVSREYDAGRTLAPAARVVAGVAEPPGPDELRTMIDEVMTGIATADFADVLFRAAAFAVVVATGRAALDDVDAEHAARMLTLGQQLMQAGQLELAGTLGSHA